MGERGAGRRLQGTRVMTACAVMFGCVRLCSVMFGYVRLCSVMFGYVRSCSVMLGCAAILLAFLNIFPNQYAPFAPLPVRSLARPLGSFVRLRARLLARAHARPTVCPRGSPGPRSSQSCGRCAHKRATKNPRTSLAQTCPDGSGISHNLWTRFLKSN